MIGEATNGEEAVELVRDKKPDVAILDISMPRLSGIDATRKTRGEEVNGVAIDAAREECQAVDQPDVAYPEFGGGRLAFVSVRKERPGDAVQALERLLETHHASLAGVIVEPLVQGAGGFRMHGPQTLQHLRRLCDDHGLLLIFDEIATGFGRTGSMFACEQADVVPDIITLSKALTGGVMPLSCAVARTAVFEAFQSERPDHALMHGPTFMANPLACAAANASLDLFES